MTLVYHWDDGTPDTTVNNAVSPDYTQHTFNIASVRPWATWLRTALTVTLRCGQLRQTFSRRPS